MPPLHHDQSPTLDEQQQVSVIVGDKSLTSSEHSSLHIVGGEANDKSDDIMITTRIAISAQTDIIVDTTQSIQDARGVDEQVVSNGQHTSGLISDGMPVQDQEQEIIEEQDKYQHQHYDEQTIKQVISNAKNIRRRTGMMLIGAQDEREAAEQVVISGGGEQAVISDDKKNHGLVAEQVVEVISDDEIQNQQISDVIIDIDINKLRDLTKKILSDNEKKNQQIYNNMQQIRTKSILRTESKSSYNNNNRRRSLSVHFPPDDSLLSSIHTRPRTYIHDIPRLYYTPREIRVFRQQYRNNRCTADEISIPRPISSSSMLGVMGWQGRAIAQGQRVL